MLNGWPIRSKAITGEIQLKVERTKDFPYDSNLILISQPWNMVTNILQYPRKVVAYFRAGNARMWYYRLMSESYVDAYRKFVNQNIAKNPEGKCSGEWGGGLGKLQYQFLTNQGLEPTDSLLDIGCGKLRGGRYFIEYLDRGNYTGMDISEEAIREGKRRVDDNLLEKKDPLIIVNNDLTFSEFSDGKTFDYLLAQSVFTHLPQDAIRECLRNIDRVMGRSSRFYATVILREDNGSASSWNFVYQTETLHQIASDNGLEMELFDHDVYPHPQGQRMLKFHKVE